MFFSDTQGVCNFKTANTFVWPSDGLQSTELSGVFCNC